MADCDSFPAIDVLGLGAVAVDDLLYVDRYPEAESKIRVQRRQRQCGGQTGTALVAAARFGVRTAYAGLLGKDALSREIVTNFAREGIVTRWAPVSAGARPAHSTIVVDESAKTRTVFASVEGDLGAASVGPEASIIRASQVLLIDHHGIEGNFRAAKIARDSRRPVVADFERPAEPPFEELLEIVDHLIVSAQFAAQVTGNRDPAEAAAAFAPGRQLAAVTCGPKGCFYCVHSEPGKVHHQPALAVEVVDTTGCGDVFHGVYAAALSQQILPRGCIRLATAAAALKAARRGGQAGIPRRDAIERFLAETL
jgi:sugar/nucleoside kinase (ribokinase family)